MNLTEQMLQRAISESYLGPKALTKDFAEKAGLTLEPDASKQHTFKVKGKSGTAVRDALKSVGFKVTSSALTPDVSSFTLIHDKGLDLLVTSDPEYIKNPDTYIKVR